MPPPGGGRLRSVVSRAPEAERLDGFLNRDLSWLDFDRRVLEAAADRDQPLLERVKLCGIVSSNLDEFFAIRAASLLRQATADGAQRTPDGRTPAETLAEVRERVVALKAAQETLWLDDLRPALAAEGIGVVPLAKCKPRALRSLRKWFEREVQPLLTPIAVGVGAPFPHVASLSLTIGAIVRAPIGRAVRFVRLNVPDDLPRFVEVTDDGTRVLLEDAILHFLPGVLHGAEIESSAVFRVTRDAELAVAGDAGDMLEAVELQLLRRRLGSVVRLEVAAGAPHALVGVLRRHLPIDAENVYENRAPLGLRALSELTSLKRRDLRYRRWRPVTRRPFATRTPAELFAQIRRADRFAQQPYDSFDTSVQAFVAAARDPKVAALKATVYRTGHRSPTLDSLVAAADADKQAVCLLELQARFDERRNIEWARALERAGVDVVHGVPDLKLHAKLALIVRRERSGLRRYAHVGTGNYHASNAEAYEDLSLFTADDDIAADVADVFNAVSGHAVPTAYRKLLVGPWFLREGILREIGEVARAAQEGDVARIRIKVNALGDPEIVDALYAASRAGAAVEIVTRGICTLRPGVPGLSDRITVRSVLGRFLEHSRVLSFQTGGRLTTWIGSADLMPGNLDRRVEVLAPVERPRLRAEIAFVLDALAADTRFAWQLDGDGAWHRVMPRPGEKPVSAQDVLMARASKRTRKA
jgi:polyphosphate kinase